MVQKLLLLSIFFIALFPFLAVAEENDCVYYFYGDGCKDCPQVDAFLSRLQIRYPQLQLQKLEVYFHKQNLERLQEFYTAYDIPERIQKVPTIIMPGSYFIGAESIQSLLEQRILDNTDIGCSLVQQEAVGVVGKGSPINVLETLTFARVTGSALKNTFSAGGLTLLILLLLYTTALYDIEEWLKKSFLFLGAVFLVYLLFSFGKFGWFTLPARNYFFLKVLGLVAIFLSLGIIKDFVGTLKALFNRIKDKAAVKKTLQALLSYPGVFIMGIISGLFTLAFSSETLLTLRGLFKVDIGRVVVVPLEIYYLIIFLLPLIALLLIVFFIRKQLNEFSEKKAPHDQPKIDLWKKHSFKVMNFITGIALLILGIAVLFI